MSIFKRCVLIAVVVVLSSFSFSFAGDWNHMIRSDARVIDFLISISSKYNIPLPNSLYQQPMHRKDVADFIEIALTGDEISKVERETAELIFAWYNGDKTLLSRSNNFSRVNINLALTGDIDMHYDDSVSAGGKGILEPGINGYIGGFSFNSDVFVWTEARNDTMWKVSHYKPYEGNPHNLFGRADSGDIRSSDLFRAGVSTNFKMLKLDVGVDHLTSGPALKNRLILNLDKSPAAFVRFSVDFKWMNYTHIVASLKSMKDYSKYLAYHRLEFPLFNGKFRAALNEVIVYGSSADSLKTSEVHSDPIRRVDYDVERKFEPIYAIPFVPFAFAEHFSGDRENALMSFDFSLRLPTNFIWYLEFLLDDISSPATLFSNDFGNKWGLTVGGKWSYNLQNKPFTVSAEYSRIEPWVYTHFKGVSHRYTHFGESGGSKLGPNSDQVWGEISWQVSKVNRFSLSILQKRWDHSYRGGDISHVFVTERSSDENGVPADSKTKKFLSGDVKNDQIVEFGWDLLPFHFFEAETRLSYSSVSGFGVGLWGGFRF